MRTENCETVLLNLKKYIEKIMHPNKSQAEYRQPAWAGVLSFSINTWYDVRIELYSLRRTESLVKLSVIKVWLELKTGIIFKNEVMVSTPMIFLTV